MKILRYLSAAALLTISMVSIAQVPEIPDPNFPDIAGVRRNPDGSPFIIYNPLLCSNMGPLLCGFYRTHEYCHIALGHGLRPNWPQKMEAEADCCAAQRASTGEVISAYNWFMAGGGSTPQHGSGFERAQRLAACRPNP